MNCETLILDGPYLSHKSFSAPYHLTTSTNLDSTLLHTFLRSLNALKKQFNPESIVIAWESHGTPSWRRELSPIYKPSRSPEPQFVQSLIDTQTLLYLLNYQQFYSPQNEADDVIATYVEQNPNKWITIYTVDKDIMQLVGIFQHFYTGKELENKIVNVYDGKEIYDSQKVKDKFGVEAYLIPDLLALAGDKADNIEGIEGIGIKKAAKLINQHGSVENILCLSSYPNFTREKVLLNKKLATLNKFCTLVEYKPPIQTTIEAILDKYELKKIKEEINKYKFEKKQSLESFF